MKGIIIAAGRGSRLGGITDNTPKTLLEVHGVTFLERIIHAMRSHGVKDICVIVGYQGHMIKERVGGQPGITFRDNVTWADNNILGSLANAHDFMDEKEDVICTYSDIVMSDSSIADIVAAPADAPVMIQIDNEFADYYEGRSDHPLGEAENVIWGLKTMSAIEVGKIIPHKHDAMGEFTGVVRLTGEGQKIWKDLYAGKLMELGPEKPWMRAKHFRIAYLTDMLQYIVSIGKTVRCVIGKKQVMEVDTAQDLQIARDITKGREGDKE